MRGKPNRIVFPVLLLVVVSCQPAEQNYRGGWSSRRSPGDARDYPLIDKGARPVVIMETSLGPIRIELWPDKAPKTVANFLGYAEEGFYDGTIFHRVIDGFMIQGGGFTPDMTPKPTGPPIENEASAELRNEVGTVAMARTSDVHSATSQFFINVANNAFLDHRDETPAGFGYAVFGRVIEGMDVLNRIKDVETHRVGPHENVPVTPVVITSVRRVE